MCITSPCFVVTLVLSHRLRQVDSPDHRAGGCVGFGASFVMGWERWPSTEGGMDPMESALWGAALLCSSFLSEVPEFMWLNVRG